MREKPRTSAIINLKSPISFVNLRLANLKCKTQYYLSLALPNYKTKFLNKVEPKPKFAPAILSCAHARIIQTKSTSKKTSETMMTTVAVKRYAFNYINKTIRKKQPKIKIKLKTNRVQK